MSIHRLNHAVLYVRNVAESVSFYRDVLGFEVISTLGGGQGRVPARRRLHQRP